MKIDPQCYKTDNIFFVRSNGVYAPCCYTSTNPQLEKMLGEKLYSQMNLTNYSYDEIVNSEAWKKIKEMIESDNPLHICRHLCAKKEDRDDMINNLRTNVECDKEDMINNVRVNFK